MRTLRIIVAGSPDFAVPALQALIKSDHSVVAVYTQPDRPAGRGRKIKFGVVKQVAVDHDIPVEQPESLKSEEVQQVLRDYQADVMVVVAYGLILPQVVLDIPKYGCLNIHGSLLPRWRGAAPIHRAIQAGDKETGITIMQMAAGLDTGDMLLQSTCSIGREDTGQTIHDKLAVQGADDLLIVLEQLINNNLNPVKQDESKTTYAHKLSKADAHIDWSKPAADIDRMIRAFNPWPAAYTEYHGKPMKIFMSSVKDGGNLVTQSKPESEQGKVINESAKGIEIAAGETGKEVLMVHRLQLPGKKAMDVADFLNGHSLSNVQLGDK